MKSWEKYAESFDAGLTFNNIVLAPNTPINIYV